MRTNAYSWMLQTEPHKKVFLKDTTQINKLLNDVLRLEGKQKTISRRLNKHFDKISITEAYRTHIYRFFKMFLKKAFNPCDNECMLLKEDFYFFTDDITINDLKRCLPFSERYIKVVMDRCERWTSDYCGYVPDYPIFIEWMEEDLLRLWVDNESVKFISEYLNVDPLHDAAYKIYETLKSNGKFGYPDSIFRAHKLAAVGMEKSYDDFVKEAIKSYSWS